MKKVLLIVLAMAFVSTVFAQKKEELVQRITQLETTITDMQGKIDNLNASLKNVSDANTLLENKISFQETINKSNTEILQQLQKELAELKKKQTAADPTSIITDPTNEEDSIISVVQQFFGAKKLEDRLLFVYNPDKVKPLMQKYYDGNYQIIAISKNIISIPQDGYKPGDKFIIGLRGTPVYMRRTLEGFKIDWEASVCYNEESLSSYSAREGTDKIIVRVVIKKLDASSYNSYGIGDNYYMVYTGETACYFLKSSTVGQRISELLKGGGVARLIVEVQGATKSNNYSKKHFIFINRIIQEDFFSK